MENQEKISRDLENLARIVECRLFEITNERYGFSLVVFNREPGERLNYISNCHRAEVITAWDELLKAWLNGMPDI